MIMQTHIHNINLVLTSSTIQNKKSSNSLLQLPHNTHKNGLYMHHFGKEAFLSINEKLHELSYNHVPYLQNIDLYHENVLLSISRLEFEQGHDHTNESCHPQYSLIVGNM